MDHLEKEQRRAERQKAKVIVFVPDSLKLLHIILDAYVLFIKNVNPRTQQTGTGICMECTNSWVHIMNVTFLRLFYLHIIIDLY